MGISPKLVCRVYGEPPGVPSECFFKIARTEVNAYLTMKYFLKADDSFKNF